MHIKSANSGAASARWALAACLLITSAAFAQTPWSVTVTPTLDPLPIGLCGAVQLKLLDPSTGDVPRNPQGARITLADFDMSASGSPEGSVAGQQIDKSHWSVCACRGASVGSTATITARYPAQSLSPAARVAGVAFQSTAQFTIAAAKGANPPACTAPAPKPVVSAAAIPSAPSPSSPPRSTSSPNARAPAAVAPASAASAPAPSNSRRASASDAAPGAPTTPSIPSPMPIFPVSTSQWADLQQSLGVAGWASMKKQVDAFMQQPPDEREEKPPPGSSGNSMPGRNQRAAVATDAWSGAIEYTYTEVSKLSKYEARGMVHIVADRAQWSGLAARMEDHSAKGCPSVFYARSAGGGKSDLVVIDYTSQNPVRGIVMPNATASAANQSRNAILTIFPNRYGLAIELPLKGSGKYTGGGPACPGYNDHLIISDADITLNDTADGKFDVDNPNRISGTKITQPFPGASLNMKWVFTRFNPGR